MSLIMPNGSRTRTYVPRGLGGAFPEWPGSGNPAGAAPQPAPQPQQSRPRGLEAYAPGRAQPIQPPSQGTPFQAYSPQQPASRPQFGGGMEWQGGSPYFNESAGRRISTMPQQPPAPQFGGQFNQFPVRPQQPYAHYPGGAAGMPPFYPGGPQAPLPRPPSWGMPGIPPQMPPVTSGPYRPTQPSYAPPPPAYQPPAEGTSRVDPGTGKAVTYSNGQWNWRPNPVSGVVAYDVSRFGDGTPAPPPPAATAPQQPADPSAVTDLTSLPFYKSLFVGDTVRRMPNGQYQVLDWSGKPVEVYASNGTEPIIRTGKGRTGNTIWGSTPEGAAENAARLQRLMEEDAPRKQAQSADIDAKLKRLEELRTAALRRAKAGKFREGGFKSPEYREYNDLMNFASALDDDRTQWDQLTAQQRNMVRRLNPTAAF